MACFQGPLWGDGWIRIGREKRLKKKILVCLYFSLRQSAGILAQPFCFIGNTVVLLSDDINFIFKSNVFYFQILSMLFTCAYVCLLSAEGLASGSEPASIFLCLHSPHSQQFPASWFLAVSPRSHQGMSADEPQPTSFISPSTVSLFGSTSQMMSLLLAVHQRQETLL